MVPASTLKVVTAASVVEHFSDSQTVATRLLFDGQDQLVLQGGGDPELTSLQLSQLAKARLPGKVKTLWLDSRLFTQATYPPGWSWDDLEDSYAPEIRALLVDHGLTTLPGPPWLSKKLYPLLLLNEPPAPAEAVNLRNSDLAAGYALQWALRQNGVEVGQVLRIPVAQDVGKFTEVARVTSRPLHEVLRRGLAVSDNLVMECLHRLCREERPRDLQGDKEIRIVDGSGLSRYNLVTAKVLGEVVWNHPSLHLLFPTPGGEGTLSKRFLKTPLQDHLWAKTGTMSGVSGLTGEFTVNDKVYVFAMLTNGSVGPARLTKLAEDEWLTTLYGLLGPPE